jgi:hypothetical protein
VTVDRRRVKAAQAVGRAAGRKPKFGIDVRVVANEHAPSRYRGRIGTVKEIGPGKSEYRVNYGDGLTPQSGRLMSWWLDLKRGT